MLQLRPALCFRRGFWRALVNLDSLGLFGSFVAPGCNLPNYARTQYFIHKDFSYLRFAGSELWPRSASG
jgi:hypothetical protein